MACVATRRGATAAAQAPTPLLFLSGRMLFFRPDGSETFGRWLPNVLAAYGGRNVDALEHLPDGGWPGVMLVGAKKFRSFASRLTRDARRD